MENPPHAEINHGPDRTAPNQTGPLGDWGVGGCQSRRGIQSQLKKKKSLNLAFGL